MLKTFANLFKIPDLRARIFFTIALVAVARLLAMIPTPGVDWSAIVELQEMMKANAEGGLLDWFDTFTGGALTQCSIGTLSIWPYISAQIIIQLIASSARATPAARPSTFTPAGSPSASASSRPVPWPPPCSTPRPSARAASASSP